MSPEDLTQASSRRFHHLQQLYNAIFKADGLVLHSNDEYHLLTDICYQLTQDTPYSTVCISCPDAPGWRLLAAAGPDSQKLEKLSPLLDKRALINRAWNEGKAVWRNDDIKDIKGALWVDFVRELAWRSVLAVPITRAGKPWAVIAYISADPGLFDPQTIELSERIAELIGRGLDEIDLRTHLIKREHEQFKLARTDTLTGLPNRLALKDRLREAGIRAHRYNFPYAVVMLDLDGFKPVNDRFGHGVGDLLLKDLAGRLTGLLRETDFLARLGGDEFVIVLEHLDSLNPLIEISHALSRLHQAVESLFSIEEASIYIDFSAGVAVSGNEHHSDALLREADVALYQAKQRLPDQSWWRTLQPIPVSESESLFELIDPFSLQAIEILQKHAGIMTKNINRFIDIFYHKIYHDRQAQAVIAALSEDELTHLKRKQAEHLCLLASPGLEREELIQASTRVGCIHSLVGVDTSLLLRFHTIYRVLLTKHLSSVYRQQNAMILLDIIIMRLDLDMQSELQAMDELRLSFRKILRFMPSPAVSLMENLRAMIENLGHLPGVCAVILYQPDTDGLLNIVAAAGPAAGEGRKLLADPAYHPRLDPHLSRGRGIVSRAWHHLEIEVSDNLAKDHGMARWKDLHRILGIRSALAIPIRDPQGHADRVLTFYGAYPHQFSHENACSFAEQLQYRIESMDHSLPCQQLSLQVSSSIQESLRKRLFNGGLALYFQPVVDLVTGRMVKVEALARLIMDDGEIVSPGVFLPLLGAIETYRLFWMTLQQALEALRSLNSVFPNLQISVNLSPSSLLEEDIVSRLQDALKPYADLQHRLTLEVLETEDIYKSHQRDMLQHICNLGIGLALDDLGTGYSSLLRLIKEPFDTLKIDQNLVRHLDRDPTSTLTLLSTLTQLAHDLNRELIAEGLETPDLIEAAQYLGITLGQGYAIARPMPADALQAWAGDFRLPVSHPLPTTLIGTLAFLWHHLHDNKVTLPGSYETCPGAALHHVMGIEDNDDVDRWHRLLHTVDATNREKVNALRHLFQWVTTWFKSQALPVAVSDH